MPTQPAQTRGGISAHDGVFSQFAAQRASRILSEALLPLIFLSMREAEPHILIEKRGALGLITLNRPKALNALTHGMCIGFAKALEAWADDDGVLAVAVRGAGPRAFCAGGDIRALWESGREKTSYAAKFLADEYRLNARIAAYPKPYVALLHGIVMGGGAGVSIHGRFRVSDATLAFAMPETGIGFLTDIGGTYFLSRLPGESGMYLALTGARITRGDAMALGLVTHAADDHETIIEALARGEDAATVMDRCSRPSDTTILAPERARIDRCFSAASVEAILERLERDGSAFAAAAAQAIRARSPSACKWTYRALRAAKTLPLADCLKMEYRVGLRAVGAHDFQEGVRAILIDKDGTPRWNPASLAGVTDADIVGFFASLGPRELVLP